MDREINKINAADTDKGTREKNMYSFQIVEAYKALRTNLLFALAATERKTVILSSPEPHAGKSTTASNLSIVMAQTNFKVLLIDADMRKPVQDRVFRVSREEGLSKVLGGMTAFENAVARSIAPNLDFLSAGPIPPNPQELLASEAMAALLREAEKTYDYILIDMPPINVVADALILVKETAGLMMVVREGQTNHEDLRKAEEAVRQIGGNLLGVLLTDVQLYRGNRRDKYYKAYMAYGN